MKPLAFLRTITAAAIFTLPAIAQEIQLDEMIVDRANGKSERYLQIDSQCKGKLNFLFLILGRQKVELNYGLFTLNTYPEWVLPMGMIGKSAASVRLPNRINFEIYAQALVFSVDRNEFCTSEARSLQNEIRKPVSGGNIELKGIAIS
jgi:hypothetical protein